VILVDWGTSNLRAYKINSQGFLLEQRSSQYGILQVQPGDFPCTLLHQIGDWLDDGETRVLLSGMVGSRQGWVEAGYLPCPVGVDELAAAVIDVPFERAEVRLVPGVRGFDAQGLPEVMRGEETQIAGLLDAGFSAGLICLPGTHSKWATVNGGRIESFLTYMTGDVYAALRSGTILGRMMTEVAAVDREAFLEGVHRSADAGGLLHHLFGVRTLGLTNRLKVESSASYLSGLLIGHEVRLAMPASSPVQLVGASTLCSLYQFAIRACGGSSTTEGEDCAARGLAAIAGRLSWTWMSGSRNAR